jgi:hypothetical protein
MMQLVLIVLPKRKEMICYSETFGYSGTTLSTDVTIILTHASVLAEGG